jgi:hypothetical protein
MWVAGRWVANIRKRRHASRALKNAAAGIGVGMRTGPAGCVWPPRAAPFYAFRF